MRHMQRGARGAALPSKPVSEHVERAGRPARATAAASPTFLTFNTLALRMQPANQTHPHNYFA